jgi:hypothetical protein
MKDLWEIDKRTQHTGKPTVAILTYGRPLTQPAMLCSDFLRTSTFTTAMSLTFYEVM